MKPTLSLHVCGPLLAATLMSPLSAQLTELPATWSYPRASLNSAEPGFSGKMRQARKNTNLTSTITRGNSHLNDLLIDSAIAAPFINTAVDSNNPEVGVSWPGSQPLDPGGTFTVPTVVNFSGDATGYRLDEGQFSSANGYEDLEFPGLPGAAADGSTDFSNGLNFSVEFVAFLDLPAGPVTFGVRSDDAMQLAFHPNDARDIFRKSLLSQDSNVAVANRTATVNVAAAGLYSVRLLLAQWQTDSMLEFYYTADGNPVLINAESGMPLGEPPVLSVSHSGGQINLSWSGDGILQESPDLVTPFTPSVTQSNPQNRSVSGKAFYRLSYTQDSSPAIKAYRSITTATRPYVSAISPASGETGIETDTNIVITMENRGGQIPVMRVKGNVVVPDIVDNGSTSTITYDPASNFIGGETVSVELDYGNTTSSWSFITKTGQKAVFIAGSVPLGGADAFIATRLATVFGLDVVSFAQNAVPASVDAAAQDAVLIFHSSTVAGATAAPIATALSDNPIPVICSEGANVDEFKIGLSTGFGNLNNNLNINILVEHATAGGLAIGTYPIFTSVQQSLNASPDIAATVVGTAAGAQVMHFVVESGDSLLGGSFTAPNRRVFLGAIGNSANVLNGNGLAIFDSVVQWALEGVPTTP